ncbi:CHAT domain-containing protein [Neolewinella aurantiaca]|uniref:CHAT domain-containing protein n=1 Tax=Neolewinella aurantiaca TaxID=2602767 RepID=A0A5C7FTV0_9BACT|nr:CHAT domain-containing tetratricopeptide repeat protein [Neolewinella aurantiaca]TXF88290.1 CHAT domain-containing protein [Neolewinella aurantiaca]
MLALRLFACSFLLFASFFLTAQPADSGKEEHLADSARVAGFQRALAWYKQDSFAMSRAVVDSLAHDAAGNLIVDSLSGLAYHLAGMSYYQTYDDINAVPQYIRAIRIRDACFGAPHIDQAHTRYNLANSLQWLGRPDTATYLLREAIDIYDQLPQKDTTNWLRSLKLLGVIAQENNDRELTRNTILAMVSLLEEFSRPTPIDQYQMYYDAADAFEYLGQREDAILYAGKAAAAARLLASPSQEADAVNIAGNNHRKTGAYPAARKAHLRALELLGKEAEKPSSFHITYNHLAQVALAEGKHQEALDFLTAAAAYPSNPEFPAMAADWPLLKAAVLEAMGNDDAALNQYEAGMKALAGNGVQGNEGALRMVPDSIIDLHFAINLYTRRADLHARNGRFEAALADMEETFLLQDRQREGVSSDGSRYALSAEVWPWYDRAIGLHYDLYKKDGSESHLWQAFRLSESARAYSQLAALGRQKMAMGRREQDLRRNIARLERAAVANPALEVERAEQQLRLELLLRTEYGKEAPTPAPPEKDDLVAYLGRHHAGLVEYHLGKERGFRFYLRPTGELEVRLLPPADSLRQLTEDWIAAISESAYQIKSLRTEAEQNALDRKFLTYGKVLHDYLIPESEASGDAPEQFVLVPDGALHFLPFAALPAGNPAVPVDYGKLEYLGDQVELQLAFSVRYLLELESKPAGEFSTDLLAFGPSFRGSASATELSQARGARADRVLVTSEGANLPGLLPLANNRAEVEAISKLVPRNKVFLSEAATRQAFLRELGDQRILHLSSHGMVNATDPNLSFIAFSQSGDRVAENELLFFNDLSFLPLNAQLVVLSACETSLGPVVPGETVLSLGNAFAAAGAESTLSSLWQVDDAATEQLMVAFYRNLADGHSRAEALATATSEVRASQTFAHPYYWSAMVLHGASGPVKIAKRRGWWVAFPLVLVLLSALFVVRMNQKAKKRPT